MVYPGDRHVVEGFMQPSQAVGGSLSAMRIRWRIIQVPVVLGSLERDFSREHCPVGFLAHLLAGYRHIQGSLGSSVEPEVLFRH
jgi:hypothetical protein